MEYRELLFNDERGNPILSMILPEGSVTQARVQTENRNGEVKVNYTVQAKGLGGSFELYAKNGGSYADSTGGASDVIEHRPCDAAEQINEYARAFVSQTGEPSNLFSLPPKRMEQLARDVQIYCAKSAETAAQVAAMQSVPIRVNCVQQIADGGIGIYPFMNEGTRYTLLTAIWRIGMTQEMTVDMSGYGMMQQMPPKYITSWYVPLSLYMIVSKEIGEDDLRTFVNAVNTVKAVPAFDAWCRQIEEQNTAKQMNDAHQAAMQNQAMIDQMWAQHNAAWARTEAMSRSLSRDMDSFRAGLAANSASMDAFRENLNSSLGGSGSSGFGEGGESLDDRIQRGRHEAMMGVNTYVREDGTDYEHTIMNDRVFENNLNQNDHFGTENYYGDYVPDGWHEIFRK
ncbi:MAG: hypothetical protein IKS32_08945 [Solobacterium sp.]|nr:hypothetical protein [Solobacterium sp.]